MINQRVEVDPVRVGVIRRLSDRRRFVHHIVCASQHSMYKIRRLFSNWHRRHGWCWFWFREANIHRPSGFVLTIVPYILAVSRQWRRGPIDNSPDSSNLAILSLQSGNKSAVAKLRFFYFVEKCVGPLFGAHHRVYQR